MVGDFFDEYWESIVQNFAIPLAIYAAFSFFISSSSSSKKSKPDSKKHDEELQRKRRALEVPSQTILDSLLVQSIYVMSVCYYAWKAVWIDLHFFKFFQIPASSKSYSVSTYCSNVLLHRGLGVVPNLEVIDSYTKTMVDLCSSIMSEANLLVLQVLGEYSLIECTWCKDHKDYFIFGFAYIAAHYIWFLIIVGLLTASHKMYSWRRFSFIIVTMMFFFEIGMQLSEKVSIVFSDEWAFLEYESQYIFVQRLRSLIFALSLIGLYILSTKAKQNWDENDLLKIMINATIQTNARNSSIDAIDTVVFKDDELSVLQRKYHSDANSLAKVFHKLPSTKDLKRNLLLKQNMPAIRNTAKIWVETTFRLLPTFPDHNPAELAENAGEMLPWEEFE